MKHILLSILVLSILGCGSNEKKPIKPSDVIIEAVNLSFKNLNYTEMEDMIFTECCCYPINWNKGVDCVQKEEAFYVKAKINIDLLAILSESETFSKDELITSNPHSLYGKYHNRWQFVDESGIEICQTAKFDGHNDFNLIRKGNIDEVIIGPLPKKPSKMMIEISNSKYYQGVKPEISIKN